MATKRKLFLLLLLSYGLLAPLAVADSWWKDVSPRPTLTQDDERAVNKLLDEAGAERPHRAAGKRARRGSGWDMNETVQAGVVPVPQRKADDQVYEKEILDLIPSEPAPEAFYQPTPSPTVTPPPPSTDPTRAAIERALDQDRIERGVASAPTRPTSAVTPSAYAQTTPTGTLSREIVTLPPGTSRVDLGDSPGAQEDGTAARFEGDRSDIDEDEELYDSRLDKKRKKKAKRLKRRKRRAGKGDRALYASLDPDTAMDAETEARVKGRPDSKTGSTVFRAALQGGVSLASSGSGYAVANGSIIGPTNGAMSFGGTGELRTPYFGAELEVYYTSHGGTAAETYRQFGAMASAHGRAELPVGKMRLIPKLGVGFGYFDSSFNPTGAGGAAGSLSTASGLYGIAGFEWLFTQNIGLYLDYSLSLGSASMNLVSVSPGGTESENALSGSKFDRFRVGFTFQVAPRVGLGALVVLRTIVHGSPSVGMDAHNQFLGTLSYDF